MPILNTLATTFPTFILPTIPFRRRSSTPSTTSTTSAASTSSSNTEAYLPAHTSLLRCNRCLAQICSTSQIISKGFTGRHGRAYLVGPPSTLVGDITSPGAPNGAALPNTNILKPQQRQLVTGVHTVCDISCALCGMILGWKYVAAEEELQKYKVGKFILETKRVMRGTVWEADVTIDNEDGVIIREYEDDKSGENALGGVIEFDSGDEDECEDLFMGIWSEKLARKRRKDKAWRMEA
jgi:hypothetical protein